MDAAREMMFMAIPERRRMRVGDTTATTTQQGERITRRSTRPDDTGGSRAVPATDERGWPDSLGLDGGSEEILSAESASENQDRRFVDTDAENSEKKMSRREVKNSQGETESEQNARVEREKAAWKEEDARRKASEAVLHQRLNESGKLAAQVGMPGLQQWKKQREVQRMDLERETEQSDYQVKLDGTTQEINRFMAAAQSASGSWEYRRSILNRARGTVTAHLGELSAIRAKFGDKLADFAGQSQMQSELETKMSDVDKRRKFLEDYYGVLERLAGRDDFAGADLNRLSGEASTVSPEMARTASRMRVMARRRRNVWQDVA